MKKINIAYWIVTGLFAAFMLFTGISDFMELPDSKALHKSLGYPEYFTLFIGTAKILGAITILLPGIPRLKEWAYAGLTFDLVGACYSAIAAFGFDPMMLTMLVFFAFLFGSYWLHHKRLQAQGSPTGSR